MPSYSHMTGLCAQVKRGLKVPDDERYGDDVMVARAALLTAGYPFIQFLEDNEDKSTFELSFHAWDREEKRAATLAVYVLTLWGRTDAAKLLSDWIKGDSHEIDIYLEFKFDHGPEVAGGEPRWSSMSEFKDELIACSAHQTIQYPEYEFGNTPHTVSETIISAELFCARAPAWQFVAYTAACRAAGTPEGNKEGDGERSYAKNWRRDSPALFIEAWGLPPLRYNKKFEELWGYLNERSHDTFFSDIIACAPTSSRYDGARFKQLLKGVTVGEVTDLSGDVREIINSSKQQLKEETAQRYALMLWSMGMRWSMAVRVVMARYLGNKYAADVSSHAAAMAILAIQGDTLAAQTMDNLSETHLWSINLLTNSVGDMMGMDELANVTRNGKEYCEPIIEMANEAGPLFQPPPGDLCMEIKTFADTMHEINWVKALVHYAIRKCRRRGESAQESGAALQGEYDTGKIIVGGAKLILEEVAPPNWLQTSTI